MTKLLNTTLLLLLAIMVGCAAPGQAVRVSPDHPDHMRSPGIESGDLRAVCQKMASSFLARPEVTNREKPARIAFLPVDNRAIKLGYIDTQIFLEKIRTLLIQYGQGKLQFLD